MQTPTLIGRSQAALDRLLIDAVACDDVPFVVAIVADRGAIRYRGAANCAVDAIFRIASMTKPVTSVTIMMLQERGLLDIDKPLAHYLPIYRERPVLQAIHADSSMTTRPAATPVTLRHLLAHTAGFSYTFCNATVDRLCAGDRSRQHHLPLLYDPGSRWSYGCATSILGDVITAVTGEPFWLFQAREIFRPLGMVDTGYELRAEDATRLVPRYRRVDGELRREDEPFTPSFTADGGLLGTAEDYSRFLQMLLNDGTLDGVRLLTATSVQAMITNQIGDLTVETQRSTKPNMACDFPLGAGSDKFGLGFQLKAESGHRGRSVGSFSWAGIQNTHFWGDPQQGIAVVLLTQLLPFYDSRAIRLLTQVEEVLYQHLRG